MLALRHAFEVMHAARVTLGVFDNNPAAYGCYKAVGFREAPEAWLIPMDTGARS